MINIEYVLNGTVTELDPIVESVTWSGDIMQSSRKLTVSLSNTIDGKKKLVSIVEGAEVRFKWNDVELFRGILFKQDIKMSGMHNFTCYDENYYLAKNYDTVKIKNEKASTFIKRMCAKYGIAVGTIVDTGYTIPKIILRDKKLFEMFVIALTETRKKNGKKFIITCRGGKLQLNERKTQIVQWVLENGVNILDASYSRSIEDMATQVKVMGEDKNENEVIAVVKNDALIKLYGIMQHLENASTEVTQAQALALAKQLLKELGTVDDEASIEALGISDVVAGTAIQIRESMTGIIGGYYVSTDEHSFVGNLHTMSIKLSATDELPTIQYEKENE